MAMLTQEIVVIGLASGTIAQTTARSSLFLPMRSTAQALSPFLGKLASCAYCTSHWVALGFILFYGGGIADWFAAVAVGAFAATYIDRAYFL